MEGHRKLISELDPEGLSQRLLGQDDLIAKGAEMLKEHDINGAVFLIMTDDDFKEIGISFGIRKSLIMFRERVLQLEANCSQYNRSSASHQQPKNTWLGQSSEPIRGPLIGEKSVDDIKNFDALAPEMDSQAVGNYVTTENPGEYAIPSPKRDDMKSDSEDIFDEPMDTVRRQGEKSITSYCGDCHFETDVKSVEIPRVEYISPRKIIDIVNDTDNAVSDAVHGKYSKVSTKLSLDSRVSSNRSLGSIKSIRLSGKSLLGRRTLKNWVFNRTVTWEENGEKKSASDFMKLRNENEIILEGYIQKLTGVNSRWIPNHWSSRYGVLLKSRVFLHFEYDSKTLYFKRYADLRKVERIEMPHTDTGATTLKLDIYMNKNTKLMLGFTTEAELFMWRDEMISMVNDWDLEVSEDEKKNA